MLIVIVRTIVLYSVVTIAMRVMGKREIGQLQPFELVIAIMISELAAIPMQNTGIPLTNGLAPIITLVAAQASISYLALKSNRARAIICGTPSVLIENGKIMEEELKKLRYNLNDLLEQLRVKNFPNLADVEFAIMETSGELSVIPKSQKRPVVPEDISIPTKYEGLPYPLILEGEIIDKNLRELNLNAAWLKQQLGSFGITDAKQVLFASLDTQGNLYYQKRSCAMGGTK